MAKLSTNDVRLLISSDYTYVKQFTDRTEIREFTDDQGNNLVISVFSDAIVIRYDDNVNITKYTYRHDNTADIHFEPKEEY